MREVRVRALVAAVALASAACAGSRSVPPVAPERALAAAEFGVLVDRLSEPGGYFPSDNLVSNETSYLHVLGAMGEMGVRGGAYLGVGPDQNFSYIAAIRPELAFLIDIRRDNLLQHLLFKALFEQARNRLEFLCLFLARPSPADLGAWDEADIDRIVVYIDTTKSDPARFEATAARVREAVLSYGLTLSEVDLTGLRRIHLAFFEWGLDVRYSNRGRFSNYPSWRALILQTDLDGRRANYLASETSFRFLKDLQRRNLVVPVVGDVSGPRALASIGEELRARGLRVSAFYVSNVEQYLFQQGGFGRFAETVSGLPFDERSVVIRSFFRGRHPLNVPGHSSTQLVERIADFARVHREGGFGSYLDVVTRNVLPLRREGGGSRPRLREGGSGQRRTAR